MSANQGRKINTYQEVTTLETGSNFIINQLVGGVLKVKQLTKAGFLAIINALIVSARVESITHANLLIKVNAGLAEVGKKYLITNATAAQFNLEVEAVAANQIGCEAKDPLYPLCKIKYDFENDNIYEVEIYSYDSFTKYSALASVNKIAFAGVSINLVSNVLALSSGVQYVFNNTIITHEDITKKIVSATNVENFSISGRVTISGTKLTNETNQLESGLYLKNCKNYSIDGVVVTDCRFCGIELDAPDEYLPNERGDRGKFSNISLNSNNYPIYIAPLAEYNVFTNITASSNLNAFLVQGGNNNFSVCNIVDNQKGVWVLGGANDAHGVFSGCNINHNTEYNLLVEDIVNGETFVGCHFYGDDAEGVGKIQIQNSRGVNIQGGIIDAAIFIVTGDNGRCHSISNNYIAGSYTSISGDFLENIFRKNNFTISGQWASNN